MRTVPATRRRPPVFGLLGLVCVLLALPLLAQGEGEAPAAEALEETSAGPEVVVVAIHSPIHPVSAEVLDDAVREAESRNAAALVVELDTPGGLMTSMRSMIQSIFASRVPVVVYVAPPGAQAASAGFFLLMAADVAAMAPGTNAGAAAAVTAEGQDIEGTMGEKVEQDARAQIRSLAKGSGRNVELAEAAVTEARSYDADQALEEGLIEIVAPTLADLLQQIDGRTVEAAGEEVVLRTARAVIERVEPTPFQRARGLLAQPNIALMLLSIGSLGLMMELYNPGAIFPGVVGAICLILGFYSLSVLPINAAGLLLLGLALVFFVAEIKVTSYGLLTLAGVISLVLGGLMLFDTADPALRVSIEVLATAATLATAVVLFLMFQVLRAHRNRVQTGIEGMVTERGRAWNDLRPEGKVFVHGELWDAVAEAPVAKGERVEVVAVDGMTLRVRGLGQSVSGPTGTPAPAGEG